MHLKTRAKNLVRPIFRRKARAKNSAQTSKANTLRRKTWPFSIKPSAGSICILADVPGFTPALNPVGSAFRRAVWEILLKIPYGKTTTYGQIAREIAAARGLAKMSAQAVGGVVGHNEISIIIPCHRIVGTHGSLTGYAGGIDRKIKLLQPGGVDMRGFFYTREEHGGAKRQI